MKFHTHEKGQKEFSTSFSNRKLPSRNLELNQIMFCDAAKRLGVLWDSFLLK